ncbi:hypothetical protein F0562_008326 [Nyssa sinensis]|uniref:Formin-like protein n=1 Tax=Nyssa sinensis TaxID=561372 RepID=A0A5J5AAV8_9ASTE|nr:hypothetical protein F0562_008326 [Nyssa sinensis]
MNAIRVCSVIVFVVFLCVLAVGDSEANRRISETPFGNGVAWNFRKTNEDTAEQVWIHCTRALEDSEQAVEDLDLYSPQAIIDLPPQVKRTLLDCLRKKNIPFHVTGNAAGSRTWFIKCLELLFGWPSVPRRYLVRKWHRAASPAPISKWHQHREVPAPISKWHRRGISPAPISGWHRHRARSRAPISKWHGHRAVSPAPTSKWHGHRSVSLVPTPGAAAAPGLAPTPGPAAESPSYAPAPSYFVPASSPSPILQPPSEAPAPSLPQDLNDSPPPPSAVKHPPPRPQAGPPHPSNNNSDSQKNYIIAATAAATLAFVALLLFCFLKGNSNKIGPTDGKRDEKPLLNFFSSAASAGSSQKSHGVENLNKVMKTGSDNNLTILSDSQDSSQDKAQSSETTAGAPVNINAPLPLPPGKTAPPPPGPPPPPPKPPAPRPPPPPPKVVRAPPIPPKSGHLTKPSPLGPHHRGQSSSGEGNDLSAESDAPKTKLKPLFWDKVPANADQAMVWHDIKAGSFQFNEERIESLFGYIPSDKDKNERRKDSSSLEPSTQFIQVIDAKKSQNLAILLKALNVTTEEVCDALKEGNELPIGLVQTLLKMAPTAEEELKLRLFSGDLSQLGPAERFLKVMVDIPFAFKRLESLSFMSFFQEDVPSIKESFQILEVACDELKNSRLFLKLLEAVLKTGNRMNDGTFRGGAQAFKLDTLLKLSDVKGTDGKTTLLHFVVQEIIRTEGIRAARKARENQSMSSTKSEDLVEDSSHETEEYYRSLGLQVVSGLDNDLENVRKAALVDGDNLMGTVSKLGHSLLTTREFVNNEMKHVEEGSQFHDTLASFVERAENDLTWLLEEEKRIMALVKSTVDYFQGNAGKDEGLRLFVIVRDFLTMVVKACKEVKNSAARQKRTNRKEASTAPPSQESRQPLSPDVRLRLFPAIRDQRMDNSSSDDESSSP